MEWIGVLMPVSSTIPVIRRLLEYLFLHITCFNENSAWILSLACFISTLTPVIADCVGKKLSILGKVGWCEWDLELFRCFVLTFGVLVPGDDGAFTAESRKCVVPRVECDAVDWKYVSLRSALLFLTMTLEAKVILLAHLLLVRVDVFDATSSLNWTNSVSPAVSETRNWSCSKF